MNVHALFERAVQDKVGGSDERFERNRGVLYSRLGVGVKKQTLQEIGENQGVTRERIRQIESKLVERATKLFRLSGGQELREYWGWEFDDE